MIRYVSGDATQPQTDGGTYPIIVHVVNDMGLWGAGFTAALTRRFGPFMQQRYRSWWCMENAALGSVYIDVQGPVAVAHLMAQHGVGRSQQRVVYPALDVALTQLPKVCDAKLGARALSFHMPRIGCGLGGGSWAEVEPILNRTLPGFPITVYDLDAPTCPAS